MSVDTKRRFYVYEHWRPDRDVPFYVGKGTGRRARMVWGRNRYHKHITTKLRSLNMILEVRIVAQNLSEEDALHLEMERIAHYRANGLILANLTNGGEGSPGVVQSDATREKRRQSALGRQQTAETRAKRSASMTGIVRSCETRKRIAGSKKNPRPEVRARNSAAAKKSWADPDWRSRQIESRLGAVRITDGTNNRTIRPEEIIPAGWRRGMTKIIKSPRQSHLPPIAA